MSSDLPGVNPATLNGMLLYYRLMSKWSGLGDSTELSRVGLSHISVVENPVLNSKTKHIEVRYHFLRDNVEKGKITLIHVPTHDQLTNIFTKPLDQATFTRLRGELGVCLIS
jgi:hypothetical protein